MTDVIVVGSGLAGMTAAVYLSEAGYKVHVYEAHDYLGGRTASWNEHGMEVESGLHRYLGFYTALPNVLEKVGVNQDDILCWEDEVEIRLPDGPSAVLGLAPFHKPFKTMQALVGHNDFLPPEDKVVLSKMFAAGVEEYLSQPEELDTISVYDFAKKHDVSERAIVRILKPLTEGIFFVPVKRYSAYNFFGLFVPFTNRLAKLRVGAFLGGMSDVMIEPMAQFVRDNGGEITKKAPVERLSMQDDQVSGVVVDGRERKAKHVILAASLDGAKAILRHDFADDSVFASLFALPTMPAATLQIELTSPSMEVDRTTFGPKTALASFAEQSRTTFQASPGRLSVILSPPEDFLPLSADEILPIVIADAKKLGIELEGKIKDYRKISHPHDFHSLAVGYQHLRPQQKTSIPGLTLAGDYTKQPHLATMEGAVVSGERAVEIAKQQLL